jgi:hypothetical protein
MLDDFAIFILSHGRPDKIDTYKTLRRAGYTGRVFIVIDNEDETSEKYYQNFGDKVIMFDKTAIAETFDEGDNFQDRRAVIYARNACWDIADRLKIEYFMQLDDDYTDLRYKMNGDFEYIDIAWWKNADHIINYLLEFYKSISALSIAIAQGGDYIGGAGNDIHESINRRRKAMNSFICSTDKRFQFIGRINEDVNTYTSLQNKGGLFLTFPLIAIQQRESQSNPGGMTELYLDSGTYIKSFYTVMYQPSSVKCEIMRSHHDERLHHSINWDSTVPCILKEEYRKVD